jgi:hypothetical protein
MLERVVLAAFLCTLWSCGSSSTSPGSDPGALVDPTKWVPTTDGDQILGPPSDDAECELMPIDCPEFPWPQDECVTFDNTSTCITAFVPECDTQLGTVLSVYTRMPDNRINLCNWITLEEPSLRAIRAGDQVEIRSRHAPLTAPVPGNARMTFVIGDEIALDYSTAIPSDFFFPSVTWTADKDYPAGTPLLWHVDNHGANEYQLLEVNIL